MVKKILQKIIKIKQLRKKKERILHDFKTIKI